MPKTTVFILSFGAILFLFIGCSSGQIRVESQPENAEVYLSVAGQTPKKLGPTPLNVVESTLGLGSAPYQILVSKEGFTSESVLIPPATFARSATVVVNLKEVSSSNKALNERILQSVASSVALAQNLLKTKQYDQAEQALLPILNQYPGIPTFHELMGNIHYLRKDLSKALSSYRKASELNPSNIDTQRMISRIQSMTEDRGSDRLPASGGQ